jgi:hypothetical protein
VFHLCKTKPIDRINLSSRPQFVTPDTDPGRDPVYRNKPKIRNEPKTRARRRKPSDFQRYRPDCTKTAIPSAARAARLLYKTKPNIRLFSPKIAILKKTNPKYETNPKQERDGASRPISHVADPDCTKTAIPSAARAARLLYKTKPFFNTIALDNFIGFQIQNVVKEHSKIRHNENRI